MRPKPFLLHQDLCRMFDKLINYSYTVHTIFECATAMTVSASVYMHIFT